MPLPNNLDFFIANAAMNFDPHDPDPKQVANRENAVQKAIAILSSQGLFAMFLWSYGKKEYSFIADQFVQIFSNSEYDLIRFAQNDSKDSVLKTLKEQLQSLQKIRFFENIAMQILIYARHYLKAISKEKD